MIPLPDQGAPIFEIPGYALGPEIGRGSTARVFQATQLKLKREVALKIITTAGKVGERRAERLCREAKLIATIDHPGVVKVIDAGQGEGFAWVALELIHGQTLDEEIERRGPLPLDRLWRVGEEILSALVAVHHRGVVHRDLKPGNILVGQDGRARLIDLGLARHREDFKLTADSTGLGTPLYMAPEQVLDATSVGPGADLYGLSASLYHAACGRPPFVAENLGALFGAILKSSPTRPTKLRPDLSPGFDWVMRRGLAKDPKRRYASATEYLKDWHALATAQPLAGIHQDRRRRLALRIAIPVSLILTGIATYAYFPRSRNEALVLPRTSEKLPVVLPREAWSTVGEVVIDTAQALGTGLRNRANTLLRTLLESRDRASASAPRSGPPANTDSAAIRSAAALKSAQEDLDSGALDQAHATLRELEAEGADTISVEIASLRARIDVRVSELSERLSRLPARLLRQSIEPLASAEITRRLQEVSEALAELGPRIQGCESVSTLAATAESALRIARTAADIESEVLRALSERSREGPPIDFLPERTLDRYVPLRRLLRVEDRVLVASDGGAAERRYSLDELSVRCLRELALLVGLTWPESSWGLLAYWRADPVLMTASAPASPPWLRDGIEAGLAQWIASHDSQESRDLAQALVDLAETPTNAWGDEELTKARQLAGHPSRRADVSILVRYLRREIARAESTRAPGDYPGAVSVQDDPETKRLEVLYDFRRRPTTWQLQNHAEETAAGLWLPLMSKTEHAVLDRGLPLALAEIPIAPHHAIEVSIDISARDGVPFSMMSMRAGPLQAVMVGSIASTVPSDGLPTHGLLQGRPKRAQWDRLGLSFEPLFPGGGLSKSLLPVAFSPPTETEPRTVRVRWTPKEGVASLLEGGPLEARSATWRRAPALLRLELRGASVLVTRIRISFVR